MTLRRKVAAKDLADVIAHDLENVVRRAVLRGVRATAEDGLPVVRVAAPVAFEELRDSGHVVPRADGALILFDAPHAAAVEVGSRPHRPPVDPLIRWAELRGFTDPRGAAWAIAAKIAREGTKPHWFALGSLPTLETMMHRRISDALDGASDGDEE